MTRHVPSGITHRPVPARPGAPLGAKIGCIETESSNERKSVSWTCVDGDPTTAATPAITNKALGRDWRGDRSRAQKRIGNSAGTIITAIPNGAVSPTPAVGFVAQPVGRPNGILHISGSEGRRVSDPVAQDRPATRDGGSLAGRRQQVLPQKATVASSIAKKLRDISKRLQGGFSRGCFTFVRSTADRRRKEHRQDDRAQTSAPCF